MSDPVVTPADIALVLNDESINEPRAERLIARAQTLCESVVSPLPDGAEVVVERMAAHAYLTIRSARQYQQDMADSAYAGMAGPTGGVTMTSQDEADLLRLAGSSGRSGAFTIDLLPADYAPTVPWWDANDDRGSVEVETS